MEERQAHLEAAGVTPSTAEYVYGTNVPHVEANLTNINSAQEVWQPSQQSEIAVWVSAIAELGENATASDRYVAKYLLEAGAYVEANDFSQAEADEYLTTALESAEAYLEKEDVDQKVGEKALSTVA